MNVVTSFKILGLVVRSDIGIAELKRAYRAMAKKCHPDLFNNNPVLKKQAESRMKDINLAFRIACDFVIL
ncbi:MAG: J domain-containing protein [Desulfamplus sp.]|nr:J domain-containing protein [Desulfamplus sp.]